MARRGTSPRAANHAAVDKWVAVPITALAGALVAMQAPINSGLGKNIGTFAAATVSFAIGTTILLLGSASPWAAASVRSARSATRGTT